MPDKRQPFVMKYNLLPLSEGETVEHNGKHLSCGVYVEMSVDELDRLTLSLFCAASGLEIDLGEEETENFFATMRAWEQAYYDMQRRNRERKEERA